MSLNYVTLTGTIPGATTSTLVQLVASNWLTDPVDELLLPPEPVQSYCTAAVVNGEPAGTFSLRLLATDNTAPTPSGWYWTITIGGVPGAPVLTFSFFLAYADGETQDISTLAQIEPADVMQAYLPAPPGTPTAGQVPVATGDGLQTEWADTSGTTGYPAEPVVSGTPSAGQVLTATSATAADWQTPAGGGGDVDSVTAADGSIVIGGTTEDPTVRTGTLDVIATEHPPVAAVPMNGQKLTGLAAGSASGDSVRYGQLGTAAFQPTSAFDASGAAATAQANAEANAAATYVPLSDVGADNGVASLGASGTVPTGQLPTLDQVPEPAANVAMNGHKLTGLVNGSASTDSVAFGQLPSSSSPLPTSEGGTGLSESSAAALLAALGALQVADNLSDLANAATARGNLGLGTAALQAASYFAQTANNLSDLASASQARTNLGLGTAATQPVSAFDAAGSAATAQSNAETYAASQASAAQAAAEAASLPKAGGTMTGWLAPAVATLTFVAGGTTLVNAALGNAFNVTLTASTTTLGAPSNPVDGQVIRIRVTQGTGGSFTLAYNAIYDFGAGSAPTLSTAAGKVDILAFEYVASISKWCYLGAALGL